MVVLLAATFCVRPFIRLLLPKILISLTNLQYLELINDESETIKDWDKYQLLHSKSSIFEIFENN